jgi:hypothetical protein
MNLGLGKPPLSTDLAPGNPTPASHSFHLAGRNLKQSGQRVHVKSFLHNSPFHRPLLVYFSYRKTLLVMLALLLPHPAGPSIVDRKATAVQTDPEPPEPALTLIGKL